MRPIISRKGLRGALQVGVHMSLGIVQAMAQVLAQTMVPAICATLEEIRSDMVRIRREDREHETKPPVNSMGAGGPN